MPGCLEPSFHSSNGYPLFGRCRPALCADNTFAVSIPVKLKPEKRKCSATLLARAKSAEPYDLRLARFNFKVKPAKSFRKNLIKSPRIISELKGTHPSSNAGEPPPCVLTAPYVNLSAHTALIVQPLAANPTSSEQTALVLSAQCGPTSALPSVRDLAAFYISGLPNGLMSC